MGGFARSDEGTEPGRAERAHREGQQRRGSDVSSTVPCEVVAPQGAANCPELRARTRVINCSSRRLKEVRAQVEPCLSPSERQLCCAPGRAAGVPWLRRPEPSIPSKRSGDRHTPCCGALTV